VNAKQHSNDRRGNLECNALMDVVAVIRSRIRALADPIIMETVRVQIAIATFAAKMRVEDAESVCMIFAKDAVSAAVIATVME